MEKEVREEGEEASGKSRGEDGWPCWWGFGDRGTEAEMEVRGSSRADLAAGRVDRLEQVL